MFADVSHPVTPLSPGRYSCAAVADVDGDGRCEVVLGNLDGPNRVLKWVGGQLRDVTPPALADPHGPATAIAAADVDGDGREELYVATEATVPDRLFDPKPDGSWEDLAARPSNRPVRNANPVTAVAALDRRGAGRYGFLVAGTNHQIRLYEPATDGTLTDLAPAVGLDRHRETEFTHLLPVPLTSSRTDVFGSSRHDSNALFVQESDGSFNDVARRFGLADSTNSGWTAVTVSAGDRFGIVAAAVDEDHSLWSPQPDGSFRNVASPAFAFPSAPRAVFAADFDNDGAEEILFLNVGEPNRLFRPGPHLVDPGALAAPVGPDAVAVVADLDDDGRLELLLTSAGDPAIRLFRAAGPTPAWLRVQPLTRFGAPARGATVALESGGRTQLRVISGTGPIEPVAHFGLGSDSAVDRVTVTWPDGAQRVTLVPDPRQVLRIPYPGG
jgi:FG-GAP-like repeat/ASPIC and UnbV